MLTFPNSNFLELQSTVDESFVSLLSKFFEIVLNLSSAVLIFFDKSDALSAILLNILDEYSVNCSNKS